MKKSLEFHGKQLDKAPIETQGAIWTVKKYHALSRLAYKSNRADFKKDISYQEWMDLETFAMNFPIGREVLCPVLLFLEDLSRPKTMTHTPTKLGRGFSIYHAMREVEK